jgi:hypothetical protein
MSFRRAKNKRIAKATAAALDGTMKRLAHHLSLLESTACGFAWEAAKHLAPEQATALCAEWEASLAALRDEAEAHRKAAQ